LNFSKERLFLDRKRNGKANETVFGFVFTWFSFRLRSIHLVKRGEIATMAEFCVSTCMLALFPGFAFKPLKALDTYCSWT
jgi:hypothetical protein